MKNYLYLFALGLLLSCNNSSETIKNEANKSKTTVKQESVTVAKDVNADEFKALMEQSNVGTQLIDVRTPQEFAEGTIGAAANINFLDPNFKTNILKLNPDAPVLVFCQGGTRSGKAMKVLGEAGFKEVYNLVGGYSQYSNH